MKTGARGLVVVIISLALILGLIVGCAPAGPGGEKPEQFYQGKTVTWLLSTSVTSGYSVRAQIIGPYLAKELGATVKIENQPGLGGVNDVYTKSKPDGLTMTAYDLNATLLNQIQGSPGVLYESDKFLYIADYWPDTGGLFTSPKHRLAGAKSPAELLQMLRQSKGLKAGGTTPAGYLATSEALMFEFLGLEGTGAKVITGYKGPGDIYMAIGAGELDVIGIPPEDILAKVLSGEMVALFVASEKRLPVYPQTPTLLELGVSIPKELQGVYDILALTGKAAMFPPGVPMDRVEYMRDVFQRLNKNKALQDEIQKAQGVSGPFTRGDKVQEYAKKVVANKELAGQLKAIFSKYAAAK